MPEHPEDCLNQTSAEDPSWQALSRLSEAVRDLRAEVLALSDYLRPGPGRSGAEGRQPTHDVRRSSE